MKSQAVIGCGFGDEGKGMTVSALAASSPDSLIIRYCGGQQAGHHVVLRDGCDHVFSNFGSGTLQGHDTYWTPFCTIDPIGIMNELDTLIEKRVRPTLFINRDCPVTTPYEKSYNQKADKSNRHGSCGVGVGQTFQRQEDHFSIKVIDLYYPITLRIKLQILRDNYYRGEEVDTESFLSTCDELTNSNTVLCVDDIPPGHDSIIFEGSQGLLLDMHIGFFPYVTRGNTGTKNIAQMGFTPEIFLVIRAYQTRHGNGPMTNEDKDFSVPINPYEQNFSDTFQGAFRRTLLDLDLLKYAIDSDTILRKRAGVTLVITCMDLMEGRYELTENGLTCKLKTEMDFVKTISRSLGITRVLLSRSPYPELETF